MRLHNWKRITVISFTFLHLSRLGCGLASPKTLALVAVWLLVQSFAERAVESAEGDVRDATMEAGIILTQSQYDGELTGAGP